MDLITLPPAVELIQTQSLPSNPAIVYLSRLRPSGQRSMRSALDMVALLLSSGRAGYQELPWASLRYQHIAALRARLVERYSPAMVNKTLCAVRGVLRECWKLGQLAHDDYRQAIDVEPVDADEEPAGRALTLAELGRLMDVCRGGLAGSRDAAIVAVLAGAGLRRSELVALNAQHYDRSGPTLRIRRGKGGKDRTVPLAHGTAPILSGWLDRRKVETPALFVAISKGGRALPRRLSSSAIWAILQGRARQAGIEGFSPHDLRRTYITMLLDAGVDLATVARLAGHASVETTMRYDRRGDDAKRQAVEKLPRLTGVL